MTARRSRRIGAGFLETLESRTHFSSSPIPFRISSLNVTRLSSTSIQLDWKDSNTDEISYRIYRTTDDPTQPNTVWTQVITARPESTKWIDRNLTPSTQYYYEVRVVTDVGVSDAFPRPIADASNPIAKPAEPTKSAITLPSDAFAGVDNATGDMIIRGTNDDDIITVTAAGGNVTVTLNALTPLTFPAGIAARFQVFGLEGNDRITIGDQVSGSVKLVNILGGNGNDTLVGNDGNDRIDGGNGRDSIDGGIGNDSLFGSAGNDRLSGGADDDLLDGGAGNDRLQGGDGNDLLIGGSGHDQMFGESGRDSLIGDARFDILDDI